MKHPNHIALDRVLEEPVAFAFELPFSLGAIDREPLLAISPVRLEGTVSPIEGGFSLDARCAFGGKLECSRCLAAYPFEVDEPFSLVVARRAPGAPDVRELSRGDLDVSYFDGDTLDVAPIAEERVQMSIPMKPLCREDCLGLCPRCGKDRNAAPCDCAREESDARWGALEQWKNATKSQKA
jgi:uncharacterized protein